MDLAVHARGLVKHYGDKIAVDHLDLAVPVGSWFGVVGPNGAGKTTSIRMIVGLLRPDAGSVSIGGIDVWPDPTEELLLYIGLLRKLDRHDVEARATQLLDVLGLNEAANELVADYSTGMRKKVALAAALLHSPSVLLLDEPFESVDPVSSKIIVDVLQHYRASGGTIVFSSHVMDTVERLCDHVAIVSAGKVERNGPIETLTDGGTTRLEDVFIDAVGASAEEAGDSLSWLVDLPSPVTEQSSRIRVRHDLRHRFCHGANCAAGRRKQRRGCLWHSSRHVGQPWSVNERARIRCRLVVDGSTHAGPRAGQPDRPPAHRTAKPAPAHVAVGFGRGRVDRRVEARALGFAARGCGRGQCAHVRHRHFGGVTRGVTGLGQPIRQPPGKRIPWTPAGRDRHCWHDLHRCAVHADLHRGVPGDRRMVGVAHAAGRTGLCKRRVRPGRPVGRALPAWPAHRLLDDDLARTGDALTARTGGGQLVALREAGEIGTPMPPPWDDHWRSQPRTAGWRS
ncbi:ABC transporter ATP-binding protein NatA [Nymphon striatum]|nr:ABC transporter ATP-binding protein NatA [Nymphon striatum]